MEHTAEMLRTHPQGPQGDADDLRRCIEACFDCSQTCTSCADACLAEQDVKAMVRCIRLNLDCAEICGTTGSIASRQTERNTALFRAQLEACAAACSACATECEKHSKMEHCRVCARACRTCEEACRSLLGSISA